MQPLVPFLIAIIANMYLVFWAIKNFELFRKKTKMVQILIHFFVFFTMVISSLIYLFVVNYKTNGFLPAPDDQALNAQIEHAMDYSTYLDLFLVILFVTYLAFVLSKFIKSKIV